ncbi:phytanoyl-CoA dioxygenase family protein [Caulobacter sp. UNC358MFTsu5.1]|uniref:phytanoyl-CoA dioxygenase family protein n=1 Tax=Caulobacter sp. UNC358MFTsu5.1 TaxID=1449049 RepID=UPI0004A6F3EB|nr:phytanoyl-CoA dioxygenase family protein [Caulobacter sp. UNC358MFTsu5.1]
MSAPLDFARDGAALFPGALAARTVETLRTLADERVGARPGARLRGDAILADLLAPAGTIGALAARLTSPAARPVRAVMFDKTPDANWAVAWHQDRVLPVAQRVEVEGFGPWSTKDDLLHVAPPFEILARMVTLRVHLDPVDAANAPLRAALGSHRLGRVAAGDAAARAAEHPVIDCLAETGDVWAYATPILHASDRAEPPRRRRVLQVDYADFDLPGGLAWAGLA